MKESLTVGRPTARARCMMPGAAMALPVRKMRMVICMMMLVIFMMTVSSRRKYGQ